MDKRVIILTIVIIALLSSAILVASQRGGSVFSSSRDASLTADKDTSASTLKTSFSTTRSASASGDASRAATTNTETCRDRLAAQDGTTCDAAACWNDVKSASGEVVGKISSVGDISGAQCPQSGTATLRITNPAAIGGGTGGISDQFEVTVIPFADAVRGGTDGAKTVISAVAGDSPIQADKGGYVVIAPYFKQTP